jgi:hypothetical protein
MLYADFCCGKKKWGKGREISLLCGQKIPGMFIFSSYLAAAFFPQGSLKGVALQCALSA